MSGFRWDRVFLPWDRASPAAARRFVRRFLGEEPYVDQIELLVSEVVSNAALHAHSPAEVTVCAGDDGVRIEVADTSPEGLTRPPANVGGGYGLRFLDELATAWGVQRRDGGKSVWFEIATSGRARGQ
jgi:anti-sigma regulatory factor (Ser/Thr protein kinase)